MRPFPRELPEESGAPILWACVTFLFYVVLLAIAGTVWLLVFR